MSIEVLRCPNCGATVNISIEKCIYCKSPVIVKTISSVNDMSMPMLNKYISSYSASLKDGDIKEINMSVAICYMKLKLYDKALPFLQKSIEENFDNSTAYFYYALCVIGKQKPFLHSRKDIDTAEDYLRAGISIEEKGVFYFFWAYIRYDYFFRKSLFPSPSFVELLSSAKQKGVSKKDVSDIFDVLGQQFPTEMLSK